MNYIKFAFLFFILNNQFCWSSQPHKSPVSLKSVCIFSAGIIVGGIVHAMHQNQMNLCDPRLAVETAQFNFMEELRAYYRFGYDPQRTAQDTTPYPQQHSLYWEYRGGFAQECGQLKRAAVDAKKSTKK
jgi:hypothetical protein